MKPVFETGKFTDVKITNSPENQQAVPFRFAISATFTADLLQRPIAFWGHQLGTEFAVGFAPYNQLLQTLLNPESVFARNHHGVNVLLARLEDLGQFDLGAEESFPRIEENLRQLLSELRSSTARFEVPLVFCLCPPSPEFAIRGREWSARLHTAISAALEDTPGVHFIDSARIEQLYPVKEIHSAEAAQLAHVPFTEEYFVALATTLVRYTHSLIAPPFKVISLDCDNTLWQGICGEDGPEGVVLDPARRALQEAMLEQRSAGMLLTLASKNNEEDVLETFRVHPEMPLQARHFAATRLNWEPKPDNLAALSEQLSLGLDTFIFIDDNPRECAEVQEALPEVLTLALPEEIDRTPQFLAHVWALDHPIVTEEDRNRNAYYRQEQEFGEQVKQASSLEHFMQTLQLAVDIKPLTEDKVARASQLTQRTNQFNLTTIRRTEAEIRALLESPGWDCFMVDVADRFGHYGLVGLLITETIDADMRIDTLLLSCRALGRGVEHEMLSWLGRSARERGVKEVEIHFSATSRNKPAKSFLESLDIGSRQSTETGWVLRANPDTIADVKWMPPASSPEDTPGKQARKPDHHRTISYARIASTLSTTTQILEAMREIGKTRHTGESMTDVEKQLARIWAELLERDVVSRTDNFFDLGGHSLLAVLLLLRVKEVFGVELSIDEVYSGSLTLSNLAVRVEAAQLGGLNPDDYAALLAEIEGLSDDEARELLESEGAGQA